ncbi:MAG: YaiI/YqxD family protein [Magnetospiraceae bacterium]
MVALFIDADACPVKDEAIRVADRHGLQVHMVSNGGIRPSPNPRVNLVIVPQGPDAADDWIAENIAAWDICVTNDIPLGARCLEKQALALRPNGDVFSEARIGMDLANRQLMQELRETGAITGGPRPFGKADRSAFLSRLENIVREAMKGQGA